VILTRMLQTIILYTNYQLLAESLESCQDFFVKTKTRAKTSTSRPRPRLYFLSSKRLETMI